MAEFIEVMKQKERMCEKYNKNNCAYCPLEDFVQINCDAEIKANPQEAEEIIMKWAEEHKAQTNAGKFKEVFGLDFKLTGCDGIECPTGNCNDCEYKNFWEREYKEPKEVE